LPGLNRSLSCFCLGLDACPRSPTEPLCPVYNQCSPDLARNRSRVGGNSGDGNGCQWFGKDEESYAIIQAVGPDFWVDPQRAPGYEPIPKLGQRAYSHPDLEGGWRAMALTPDAAISVVMIGKTATRSNTISLIRQVQERRAKAK